MSADYYLDSSVLVYLLMKQTTTNVMCAENLARQALESGCEILYTEDLRQGRGSDV